MNILGMLALVVVLAGAGGFGLRLVAEVGEQRRSVRWAHTLARFCGDAGCGVCRSRSLSAEVPRVAAS
ncbi:hypothetical protein [Actinomadura bangladeshensis]|uniref:Uncharacterized protein n=1 Tax=Actinomadura bangladeshensis TaxID=453573 RepID=A0A4V6PA41_9ACTN|nr:hypothetical protein [Actinomadura bangladeshensis]TDC16106.1 hypothetical protein E1284_13725 [Actinomadura bangladeshensis]